MPLALNWTSTKVPLWQSDCENFWRSGRPFELRGVNDEHMLFVEQFSRLFGLGFARQGHTVVFSDATERSPKAKAALIRSGIC